MSKIEISVDWQTPAVFAGEKVQCIITFTNIARRAAPSSTPSKAEQTRAPTSARERWKLDLPSHISSTNPSPSGPSEPRSADGKAGGHRPTLSVNVPVKPPSKTQSRSGSGNSRESSETAGKHKRSVSILSIGQLSTATEGRDWPARATPVEQVRHSHGRSASADGLPIRRGSLPLSPQMPQTAPPTHTQAPARPTVPASTRISPRTQDIENQRSDISSSNPSSRHEPMKIQDDSLVASPNQVSVRESENPARGSQSNQTTRGPNASGLRRHHSQRVSRAPTISATGDPTHRSLQRVMSPNGGESTPRSSMDIYSHSNQSSETLQSEYIAQTNTSRPFTHKRDGSQLGLDRPVSETLMMGYVQLVGSFILEGSLVNLAPFDAVKRKAVIGGQGSGGVVGIEAARRDNGLFGSLGWSSIGQSLGGLLGPEEPSSIREMKGIASSKDIPIISTAQSILFVDLQLKPGESKQFSYSHHLPRGLPPSFKGRAIKCSYQIVVGTQRLQNSRAQQPGRPQHSVRQIEVPFKVLPCIDETGEILGHDLMNPHVILRDMSQTKVLDTANGDRTFKLGTSPLSQEGNEEFTAYVGELLEGSRKDSGAGLLSPTSTVPSFISAGGHIDRTSQPRIPTKDLIDMAIAQQATPGSGRASSASLQISRGGEKVAKVLLARTAFRIGETVMGCVEFTGADVACFAFNAALESAEVVDPAIALRSSASIHRATRRIHAQTSENTIWAKRVSFALTIPPAATPEFITTGVRLEWRLRLEFVTADTRPGEPRRGLLDIHEEDERGVFSSATPELLCQSFDVPVTLRVYGTTGGGTEHSSAKGYRI